MSSNGKAHGPAIRIYDFRNTRVAHQEKEVTDPKEAQQNLVGWINGLKALTEAGQ
jgi:hypothetical protein